MNFKDKNILVLGLGRSGYSAAKLLHKSGAKVTAIDSSPADKIRIGLRDLTDRRIEVYAGDNSPGHLKNKDLLVVSPGIPLTNPLIREAFESGIPVIGELELASQFCKSEIVALTGTNGKSTTCSLIGEIFTAAGISNRVLGNIGTPLSDEIPLQAQAVVVEVSSYQLETIDTFHPRISVWLNLTPDHLGRHGTMDAYGEAKARIFSNQQGDDVIVFNADDPRVEKAVHSAGCRKMSFSQQNPASVYVEKGIMRYNWDGVSGEVIASDEIRIKGRHNLENALAAAGASIAYGIEPGFIRKAMMNFPGIEHRQEFTAEIDSVRYINDSKATNLDSTLKALETIPAPIILIAGGQGKGESYLPAGDLIKAKVKLVIAIGETKDQIGEELSAFAAVIKSPDLEAAVRTAKKAAHPGDTILLSPMCASFDMFADFEERGRVFKTIVQNLADGEKKKK